MLYTIETANLINPYLEKGFHDMDFETYRSIDAINSSGLKTIHDVNPEYFKWERSNPEKKKEFDFGKLVHLLVLEPELLEQRVKVIPKLNLRTNEGKAKLKEFEASLKPDEILIDEQDFERAQKVRDKMFQNAWTKRIMGRGKNEQTGFCIHPEVNVFCKIRADKLIIEHDWIMDVKTAADASKTAFNKATHNLHYDLQAAFYKDCYEWITGRPCKGFTFLVVESKEPFLMGIYAPERDVLEHGRTKYRQALEIYKQCCEKNIWPGYPEQAISLELQPWAMYQIKEDSVY